MPQKGEKWIVGQPGGPAGPFWSIVSSTGRVIAMQIPDEKDAQLIQREHAVYNAVMAEAKSRESRARWLELILDEVDPYKSNMLLRDWLRGVIDALEGHLS